MVMVLVVAVVQVLVRVVVEEIVVLVVVSLMVVGATFAEREEAREGTSEVPNTGNEESKQLRVWR